MPDVSHALPSDLAAVLDDILSRLAVAARDRRHPMHVPVVGTADGDLRMMVLRDAGEGLGPLRFHTDARSAKVALIRAQPRVAVLAHDPAVQIQIRARGMARVGTEGPLVDAAWSTASAYARRCYLAEGAPGSMSDGPTSGLPPEHEGQKPDEAALVTARANFAVVLVDMLALDWLHLAHQGHRRAQFHRPVVDAPWQGQWVIP